MFRYNVMGVMLMLAYYTRSKESTEVKSDKYVCVNNLGYYAGLTDIHTRREKGRVDYLLIYIKRGELLIHEAEGELCLSDGGICLFRPNEPQIYSIQKTPTDFFWIHFSGEGIESMLSFFEKRSYDIGTLPEFEQYCHGFDSEFHTAPQYTDMLYEGQLVTLFARIAERILRDEKAHSDFLRIREALGLMRTEYWCRRSNSELARISGVSKDCFEKAFKHVMGVTPHQYYLSLQIEKAKELLSSTAYSITEISRLCGIDDSLYFSRLFKKKIGQSPAAYRKHVLTMAHGTPLFSPCNL